MFCEEKRPGWAAAIAAAWLAAAPAALAQLREAPSIEPRGRTTRATLGPSIRAVERTTDGYRIEGANFGADASRVVVVENGRRLPASAIESVDDRRIEVSSRTSGKLSVKVRVGAITSNARALDAPRESASTRRSIPSTSRRSAPRRQASPSSEDRSDEPAKPAAPARSLPSDPSTSAADRPDSAASPRRALDPAAPRASAPGAAAEEPQRSRKEPPAGRVAPGSLLTSGGPTKIDPAIGSGRQKDERAAGSEDPDADDPMPAEEDSADATAPDDETSNADPVLALLQELGFTDADFAELGIAPGEAALYSWKPFALVPPATLEDLRSLSAEERAILDFSAADLDAFEEFLESAPEEAAEAAPEDSEESPAGTETADSEQAAIRDLLAQIGMTDADFAALGVAPEEAGELIWKPEYLVPPVAVETLESLSPSQMMLLGFSAEELDTFRAAVESQAAAGGVGPGPEYAGSFDEEGRPEFRKRLQVVGEDQAAAFVESLLSSTLDRIFDAITGLFSGDSEE